MKHYSRRELYALGETLGESVTTAKVGGGRIYGGGGSGGGGAPTQSTTVTSNIPEYAKPYVESMLGAAQKQTYKMDDAGNITGFQPYVPYGATVDSSGRITNTAQDQAKAAVAGFAPMQEQAFRQTAGLQVPGQFGIGSQFIGAGGFGAGNVAQQAAGIGNQYFNMATNPFAQQAFMSPYMQTAVDVQKQEAIRDFQKQMPGMQAQAVRQGAFGGSRQAIEAAEARRNLNTQLGNIQAQGTQKAFEAGQQAQQFGSNLGLQGFNTALQGTGQLTAAGNALGQMGERQLQAQQGIIGLQSQAGAQQQALEQQRINQAIQNYALEQQYPQLQLSTMSSLLRGLPLQQATTQQYQAAPSAISQIGGLGTAALGAYKLFGAKEGGIVPSYKAGGEIKEMASGGISDISRKILMNPDKYSKDTIERGQKNGLVDDYIGIAMLGKKVKDAEKAKQRQAAMQAGQQGLDQTIVDQIRAKAAMLGIDNAESNLPEFSAFDGGIVAMAEGGQLNDMTNEMAYAGGGEIDSDGIRNFVVGGGPTYIDKDDEGNYMPGAPTSQFGRDIRGFKDFYKRSVLENIVKPLAGVKGYFSDKAVIPEPAAAPVVEPAKPDIVIHRDNKGDGAPPRRDDGKMDEGTMAGFDPSGKGIDEIIANVTKSLDAQATARKQDKKEAGASRLIEAGLGMMAGTSPFAGVNIGQGVTPAVRGYGEDIRQYRQDEAKDIGQRAALGLKGYEAKTDLAKLGIMAPLYKAQADYYTRRPGSSATVGLGSVPPATADKIITRYEGYGADPKSAPFFSQLPKDVQTGLTKYKPGTESYNRSMEQFKRFSEQHMNRYLNGLRTLSAKSRPDEE
jgi:hypothetical protein